MIGTILSHYKITAELGRGGMGIVYRARDTNLDREVALKILPAAALTNDDDRERFYREARAAAALNHPNIAAVYQIDEAIPRGEDGNEIGATDGPRPFIAMEFIEGITVEEHIKKGPLKLSKAVNIASQVAEALKAAHAREIVHRDIKGANVMLTSEGVAKVLDFGLAKTNQSTMLTRMGSTLGTVAYMSPEQARGQEVDGRSDLYSLGTMLYEMIAGRLPFAGEYEQAVVYGILNESPEPLTAVRTGVPMQLEWTVNKLLAKDAEYRYQTAADLLADLKTVDLSGSGHSRRSMPAVSSVDVEQQPSAKALPIWVYVILVGALGIGAAAAWLLKPDPNVIRDTAVREFILEFPGLRSVTWYQPTPSGNSLSVRATDSLGNEGIFIVNLASGVYRKLPGEGDGAMRFSPDGNSILYFQRPDWYVVPISGGSPLKLGSGFYAGYNWLNDGRLMFSEDNALWIIPEPGDVPVRFAVADTSVGKPIGIFPLPGREAVLTQVMDTNDESTLYTVDLKSGSWDRLGFGASPTYVNSGHLVYLRGGSNLFSGALMVRPFDLDKRRFIGPEVALTQEISIWEFGIDPNGTFYHRNFGSSDATSVFHFYRIDSSGSYIKKIYQGNIEDPRISPDGKRVAFSVEDGADDWLLILDMETGVERRITFSGDVDEYAWSSDPELILVERDFKAEIWSSRGLGIQKTLPIDTATRLDWSPNGRYVAYIADRSYTGDLRLYDLETGTDSLLDHLARTPRFSPDGAFIAYTVTGQSSGVMSVVRATQGPGFDRLAISEIVNRRPLWSRDGESIILDGLGNRMYQIPIDLSRGFVQTGKATLIRDFSGQYFADTAPNGDIFVLSDDVDSANNTNTEIRTERVHVVVNWFERLKRLAPPSR